MSHTTEPWAVHPHAAGVIVTASDTDVFLLGFDADGLVAFINEHDARRTVACVNACAGFSTQTLEATVANGSGVIRALQRQRDELLAILESMFNEHGDFEYEIGTLVKARVAIAKIKGGAA